MIIMKEFLHSRLLWCLHCIWQTGPHGLGHLLAPAHSALLAPGSQSQSLYTQTAALTVSDVTFEVVFPHKLFSTNAREGSAVLMDFHVMTCEVEINCKLLPTNVAREGFDTLMDSHVNCEGAFLSKLLAAHLPIVKLPPAYLVI